MNLDAFNNHCAALPATQKVIQWGGSHVWKVGGKIFAIASSWGPSTSEYKIGFKADDLAFRMLVEEADIDPSPYLGRYKWVQLQRVDALSEDEIKSYISRAHELVAKKLTRARRRELNLEL